MGSSGKRFLSAAEKNKKPLEGIDADWNLISMLYKDAPHKPEQIKILSELYLKNEVEIAEYLYKHGYDDKHIRRLINK